MRRPTAALSSFLRRTFGLTSLVVISVGPVGAADIRPERPVELFPLSAVHLLDGPFAHAHDVNRRYLLAHDVDRWNPDQEWDSETIEYVAGVLEDLGLRPDEPNDDETDDDDDDADTPDVVGSA